MGPWVLNRRLWYKEVAGMFHKNDNNVIGSFGAVRE